jgi:ATP-dependent helicase HrpB
MIRLPIDSFIPEVLAALRERSSLVLQAAPGTGKTTRVPPALLELAESGEVLVLEPRRLAAKMAARRVAEERGESVGQTVGYQFRFENVTSARTRLRFLTEGMLMKRLLSDPELRGVRAVVLDEFHERHLHGDVALGFLRKLQSERRSDLRIIVMSATLDTGSVARFLGDAPVISVPGKQFEVRLEYLPEAPSKPLDVLVRGAVRSALKSTHLTDPGDLLVFLPGMAEIRRAQGALEELAREEDLLVLPLHGELSREEQDQAVNRAERRKVILSTNVAETSLTIPGVRTVIDSGLARVASYSWWSGLPALRTRPVSRASAIQRAGRAGRTEPGQCFRLYSKSDFEGRASFEVPEIQRADLSQTLLELKALGIRDLRTFPWFEIPQPSALDSAEKLLYRLGAVDAQGAITELGQALVGIPLHPRLGRLALEAARRGKRDRGALLAAALSEGRLEGLDVLASLQGLRGDSAVLKVRERVLRSIPSTPLQNPQPQQEDDETLARALLAGFPDRVARRRQVGARVNRSAARGSELELVFSSGGSASVSVSPLTSAHEWFIAVDAEERKALGQARSEVRVGQVCAITPDWLLDLEPSGVSETEETRWNEERGKLETVSRLCYDALVLDESRREASGTAGESRALAAALIERAGWEKICDPEALGALRARFSLLRARDPSWPELRDPDLIQALEEFCLGKSTLDEVREGDFAGYLVARLDPSRRADLDRLVPAYVQLPRGRRVRVHYEEGKPPWIESRLQDFFGMSEGPRILGGALPLTLHLLAPNQRAVQVTTDLAGFWKRGYAELRKQLSRRYPRHDWPEDPL